MDDEGAPHPVGHRGVLDLILRSVPPDKFLVDPAGAVLRDGEAPLAEFCLVSERAHNDFQTRDVQYLPSGPQLASALGRLPSSPRY